MLLHKEADHLYSTPSMYTHCFEFAHKFMEPYNWQYINIL